MTRSAVVVACMAAGVVLVTAGATLAAGVAAGCAVLGVALIVLAVLLGWDR